MKSKYCVFLFKIVNVPVLTRSGERLIRSQDHIRSLALGNGKRIAFETIYNLTAGIEKLSD